MVAICMGYYNFDTEVKIVQAHARISLPEAKKVVKVVRTIREKLPESNKPGTRAEIMISQGLNALGNYSNEDFEHICLDVLATKIGSQRETLKKNEDIKRMLNKACEDAQIGKNSVTLPDVNICKTLTLP